MFENKIKVIYIAGATRSGSTILSNILGEFDGFFNAGELSEIWDTGLEWPCSCGSDVKKCKIWSLVLKKIFNGNKGIDIKEMIYLRNKAAHSKHVPKYLIMSSKRSKIRSELEPYLAGLSKLYRAIQSITHSRVIVDDSKNVGYCFILGMVPMIDLYIIHLIRDARAVAYSWKIKKEVLRRKNPVITSLYWCVRNFATEMFGKKLSGKYLRIHYEKMIEEPKECVKSILCLIQESPQYQPFMSEHEVKLRDSHGICGNPDRFKKGLIKLKMDEKWKRMKKLDKILVTLLTWPLLIRYRYPIIPRF